jgi:hypothetical protein
MFFLTRISVVSLLSQNSKSIFDLQDFEKQVVPNYLFNLIETVI